MLAADLLDEAVDEAGAEAGAATRFGCAHSGAIVLDDDGDSVVGDA